MSEVAIVSIVLGVLVVVVRGPLLVAPEATIEIYRQILVTDDRIRIAGMCGTLIGLWMVLSVSGSLGIGAWIFWVWGWVMVVGCALFLLVFVSAYRAFAETVIDLWDSSAFARPLGAIAAALGALLVCFGVFVF